MASIDTTILPFEEKPLYVPSLEEVCQGKSKKKGICYAADFSKGYSVNVRFVRETGLMVAYLKYRKALDSFLEYISGTDLCFSYQSMLPNYTVLKITGA